MTKREIKKALRDCIPDMELQEADGYSHEERYLSIYLGSFMSLDPCGRYHHILSPNGVTSRCERYWENLETCASELGGWTESGEGDPTDIFFCMPAPETEKDADAEASE